MYQSSKKKINFFLYVTLIPFVLKAQLYNNQNFTELSSHFFGLAYYPSAWQSSIFEEDVYTNVSIKEKVAFNKLSNALRLNYSGAEKMLGQFKEDFLMYIILRILTLILQIFISKMKSIDTP